MAGFFGLFDYNKPGRGVSKDDVDKSGPALYFDELFRRFWKLISLNIIFLLCSLPALAVIFALSSYALLWLESILNANFTEYIMIAAIKLTILAAAFIGTGAASAAQAYVLRCYVNDTHSWVWSDFKDKLKSNFLQGTAVFIIDMVVLSLLFVSWLFYSTQLTGLSKAFMVCIIAVISLIFVMMHMYIYRITVTFKLKIKDIYRNALILTMAKLPWNLLCFAVSGAFTWLAFNILAVSPIIGFLVLLLLYIPIVVFTQLFMTNNIEKKYLLEPALKDVSTADKKEGSVFSDDSVSKED